MKAVASGSPKGANRQDRREEGREASAEKPPKPAAARGGERCVGEPRGRERTCPAGGSEGREAGGRPPSARNWEAQVK